MCSPRRPVSQAVLSVCLAGPGAVLSPEEVAGTVTGSPFRWSSPWPGYLPPRQYLPEYLRGTFRRCPELLSPWPALSSPVPCPVISSRLGLLTLSASSLQPKSLGFYIGSAFSCGLQTLRAAGWAIGGLTSFVTCPSGITVLHRLMSRGLATTSGQY